ncbi:hypothetical protein [Thioclava indica]|uniref:Uncharacterized protein n=1 Tax=Thioclava indica TaxID=1353528 RepID=A0A074JYZ0_9RHOB|nr:hypothetical protein [Thioclava indica]KEO61689.1 hypothetical protein DT23_01585 [Thioclava indica]
MDKITDEESLEKWLETRPEETRRRDAVTIAYRAAARVMPMWVSALNDVFARESNLTGSPIFWSVLTSGVYIIHPTPEVRHSAARSARSTFSTLSEGKSAALSAAVSAAVSAALSAGNYDSAALSPNSAAALSANSAAALSANSAARSANFAARSGSTAVWQQIEQDCSALLAGQEMAQAPLWSNGTPEWIAGLLSETRAWMARTPGHDFWLRWYEAALAGQPLTGDWQSHWALLRDIALIPDADWERGAEHVAGLIAVKELAILGNRPLGEDNIEEGDDGVWHKVAAPSVDADILRDSTERVLDVIAEIEAQIASGRGNLFSALETDLSRLKDRIARYPDRALRLHDTFLIVQSHIARDLQSGELPEDALVHDLSTELGIAALDLRNADPKAREVIKARMVHRVQELDDEQKHAFKVISEEGAKRADAELGAELIEDAEVITEGTASADELRAAAWRQTGRLARIFSSSKQMAKDVGEALDWLGSKTGGVGAAYFIVKLFLWILT